VHKVSIVPHGIGALGYTLQRPTEDRHLMRRGELLDKIAVLLGGRAAELLVFGEPSTGAADDLAKATDIARDMVLRFGMDEALGPVALADARPSLLPIEGEGTAVSSTSPQTAEHIDQAVRRLLNEAQHRALALLRNQRTTLDRCVQALIAQETLDEAQLLALVKGSSSTTVPDPERIAHAAPV
jgi:cell division protease FtsH